MWLSFYDTNPENSEETLIQTISIDISGLIYSDNQTVLEWTFD